MTRLTLRTTLTSENADLFGGLETLTPLSAEALSQSWIFTGAQASGTMTSYRLRDLGPMGQPRAGDADRPLPGFPHRGRGGGGGGRRRICWVSGVGTAQITAFSIGATGALTGQTALTSALAGPVTEMEVIVSGGRTFLATGTRDAAGLTIYEWTGAGDLALRDVAADHGKTALGNSADMTRVRAGGTEFLVVGSTVDEAISTYRIGADGTAELIDTLGTKDGMWVAGLDSLASVSAHGESYVVVGGTNSSSLTLVRGEPSRRPLRGGAPAGRSGHALCPCRGR